MANKTPGVGTPGGAKGGAYGKPDSHVVKGGPVQQKTGQKPWVGGKSNGPR